MAPVTRGWMATLSIDCTAPVVSMISGTFCRVADAAVTGTAGGAAAAGGAWSVSSRTAMTATAISTSPATISMPRRNGKFLKYFMNVLPGAVTILFWDCVLGTPKGPRMFQRKFQREARGERIGTADQPTRWPGAADAER